MLDYLLKMESCSSQAYFISKELKHWETAAYISYDTFLTIFPEIYFQI